jgi:hypothetical protein
MLAMDSDWADRGGHRIAEIVHVDPDRDHGAGDARHSSYAVTADIYSHVNASQQRAAAERLGEAFRGDRRGYTRCYIQPARPSGLAAKHALMRAFTVGLARFELATP